MSRRKVLTMTEVAEIRSTYQRGIKGYGYRELGRKYGVSESTIRDVVTNRTVGYQ